MITRFVNARLIDPTHSAGGTCADIVIECERVCDPNVLSHSTSMQTAGEQTIDMSGCFVMAGAIDLHTHIGGGKLNLARLLMQDALTSAHSHQRGPLWSSVETGRKYAVMGYTACFEPAMLLPQARSTHLQLADTPLLDSGAYVVMGNEDWLLQALGRRVEAPLIEELVAWTMRASQALAVKVVNPGGISAFKFNQRTLDVDQPHPLYGATPRDVIRQLSAAVDQLGLPHPLHVHASNLGTPGNISSTLATLDAAEGRRLHLTHAQFNAYTSSGPFGMGSGAAQLAERINRSPELTIDVGQIVFGQTVTISADTQAQFRNRRHARPAKTIVSDVECVGGCGIVPMRYESRQYVSSLQWTIGLELLLLIRNPYQVLLTTDHPNGGPFTSYPHLIRLLMDRSFRQAAVDSIHPRAAECSLLKELDREYTLDEIAIMTRLAPARLLGLNDRGHLRPGALADLVFYEPKSDWEASFSVARSVWKSGREIVRMGEVVDGAVNQIATKTLRAMGSDQRQPLGTIWQGQIEQTLCLPLSAIAIGDGEFADRILREAQQAVAL
jgi:formylmethanofuran dehydrogenase subunit A